jgi:hypothetical protein
MLASLVIALLAASPLASDDVAERLAAVEQWAKKQKKPQLSSKEARALSDCVDVPALKDTGCTTPATLCRLHEGDDGSSGTRTESLSLFLSVKEHDNGKSLRVWWSAAYEAKPSECDPPESMSGTETPDQRAKVIAAWKKGHSKEYAHCVARLEKDAKDDAEELLCDVVLVNACRREAYVTCKSRNLRQGVNALEKLHRFDF